MQSLGIETGADLKAKSLAFLRQHFGKSAAWYLSIAHGDDDRPVIADRQRKSSGSETTFERDLTASVDIEAGIEAMAADVWAWCEKAGTYGRTVTVKAKFADFRQVTRSRSFATVIARHGLPRQASLELVRTLLPTAKGIRRLGVMKFTGTRLRWRRTGPRHTTPSGARPLTRSTATPMHHRS